MPPVPGKGSWVTVGPLCNADGALRLNPVGTTRSREVRDDATEPFG
jgi:hypothetical protein